MAVDVGLHKSTLHVDPRQHPDNANIALSNRPATILGVTITFLIVANLAALLRIYVRFRERLWGWDDVCIFVAAAAIIVGSSLICLMPDDGMGLHFWTLPADLRMAYFKHVWATNVAYCFSTTFIKLAILLQYLRLFDTQHKTARKITWCLLVVTSLWGLVFALLSLFSCAPIAKNWDFTLEGKCVAWGSKDPNIFFATWTFHSASNMMIDILVLLLPVPFFRQLSSNGKTRLGLMSLFSMGAIVVVISTARVVSLCLHRAGTVPVFDPSYHTPPVYILSVLEVDVAILCASIPIFWPLVTSFGLNKILIVNEITIRTERRSEHIDLMESTKGDFGDPEDGRTSRISVLAAKQDSEKGHGTPTRLARSLSRQHKSKPSSVSAHKAIGLKMGKRPSQESQRDLQLSQSTSNNSFSSLSRPDHSLQPSDGTVARYADKYMQDWAVPDFNKGAPPVVAPRPTYTTTVERAEVPYSHIGSAEK